MNADRRQSPRVYPERPLTVTVDGLDTALRILDVSFGGLRVVGPVCLDREGTHYVHIFGVVSGRALEIPAKAVYSVRQPGATSGEYETGLAFMRLDEPETGANVQALMDTVTAVLVIE